MRLNSSAAGRPARWPLSAKPVPDALAEGVELVLVTGLHRRLELALVRLERGELAVDHRRDVLGVVGLVRLPQQQGVRAVVRQLLLGEEVRVASGHDAVADEQARRCGGPGGADSASTGRGRGRRPAAAGGSRTPPPTAGAARSRARRRASRGTRPRRSAPSARAAARCSCWRVTTSAAVSAWGSHVPLAPSVQTRWCTTRPGRGPLGQRAAAAELHVVGVGGDGQGDPRASAGPPTSRRPRSPRVGRARWRPSQHLLHARPGEVVGQVDVEPQPSVAPDADAEPVARRLGAMVAERSRAVGEPEAAARPGGRRRWCRRRGGRARG